MPAGHEPLASARARVVGGGLVVVGVGLGLVVVGVGPGLVVVGVGLGLVVLGVGEGRRRPPKGTGVAVAPLLGRCPGRSSL